jgi:ribosome biogenesis GTPase
VDETWHAANAAGHRHGSTGPGATPGRVVSTSRRFTYVATGHEVIRATAALDLDPPPVTGDWVGIEPGSYDDEPTVTMVLARHTELARRDPSGRSTSQVLAANVDVVMVVLGLDRPVKAGRVERSLVLAREAGATAVLVLTKTDAVDEATLRSVVERVQELAGGASVVPVSVRSGQGLDALHSMLDNHCTVVLLGESGAGKSSLLNRLAGTMIQRTADVRAGDAKGRHTTVTRDLVVLPTGGIVIDTPGLRGLGLVDAQDGLDATFADVAILAQSCRFRDCRHDREPGCAVRTAVGDGTLPADRLDRYLALQLELDQSDALRVDAERRRPDRGPARSARKPPRRPRRDDAEPG